MDEDEFSLNTATGRFNRMEAAIGRAFERRQGNAQDAWQFASALDYVRDSELRGASAAENAAANDYTNQRREYGAGRLDIDTMEDAGYTYIAAVNFHEQVREQRIGSERARQESIRRDAARAAETGQRAAVAANRLLPGGTTDRRRQELQYTDQRTRGRRDSNRPRGGGHGR
ncbi:hypothetical protein ACWD5R_05830 [Streptomyces sp. NPDC002514]|uniref:hypothetical protein n=1 Tax=Streptomyces sp. NPDC001270 TaxID=3364554 RepID=UPI0036CDB20C